MTTVNRPTALGISTLLHVGLLCAGLVAWPWARQVKLVEVTPITLLTADEIRPLRAAEEGPTPAEATVEDPVPDAPPEPPQPAPRPQPTPAPLREAAQPKAAPPPTPAPKAAPRPPTPQAIPKVAPKTAPAAPLNLNSLAESLAKTTTPNTNTRSSARQANVSQIETDLAARIAEGQARAATDDALSRVNDRLQRLWSPNCDAEASSAMNIRVRLSLTESGATARPPELVDYGNATDASRVGNPAVRVAAERALSAAARGAPYQGLPRETYSTWRSFIARFNFESACR